MMGLSTGSARTVAGVLLYGAVLLLSVASFITLAGTDAWWVRFLDFPRPQMAVALPVLLLALVLLRRPSKAAGWAVVALGVGATGYHASKLWPYNEPAREAAVRMDSCPAGRGLRLMIANVQRRNERAEDFLRLVSANRPDVLLVMETDEWWDRHLGLLDSEFSHSVQHVSDQEEGAYGMHLFSRLPLVSPEFRFLFDAFTPSVFTGIRLESGTVVRFFGMHPQPPQAWSQPTTLRDAQLLSAGLDARSSDVPAIVAGDLNSVPWEPVVRRTARLGRLLDPRIGRGLHATFRTGNPFFSWPLDQVLFQDQFALTRFEVLPDFGSDHLPVIADLCHAPAARAFQTPPKADEHDIAEARSSMAAASQMSVSRPASE